MDKDLNHQDGQQVHATQGVIEGEAPQIVQQSDVALSGETSVSENSPAQAAPSDAVSEQKATENLTENPTENLTDGKWEKFETFSARQKEASLFAKIDSGLHYMKDALAFSEQPKFTDFWACRRWLGPFLETVESKEQRDSLKSSFNDLLVEARGLKLLLDEQQRLSIDRIEQKLGSLEEVLLPMAEQKEQTSNEGEEEKSAPEELDATQLHCPQPWTYENWPENFAPIAEYSQLQGALQWSNSFAGQIQNLRKEIMQTPMRLGQKNKLLSRLSKVGDVIFPQKKAASVTLSKLFIQDIKEYRKRFFHEQEPKQLPKSPLFKLRNQIQSLQSLAKLLGINTSAFKTSREVLSSCWNRLKEYDQLLSQKKEAVDQKNAAQLENLLREVENIKRQKESGSLSDEAVLKRIKALENQAKKERLSKTHFSQFTTEIQNLKTPILEKQNAQMEAAKKQKEKKDQAIQSRLDFFRGEFDALSQKLPQEEKPQFAPLYDLLKESFQLNEQWEQACDREAILPSDRDQIDLLWEDLTIAILEQVTPCLGDLREDELSQAGFLQLFDVLSGNIEQRLERRKTQAGLDFQLALEIGEKQNLLAECSDEVEALRD